MLCCRPRLTIRAHYLFFIGFLLSFQNPKKPPCFSGRLSSFSVFGYPPEHRFSRRLLYGNQKQEAYSNLWNIPPIFDFLFWLNALILACGLDIDVILHRNLSLDLCIGENLLPLSPFFSLSAFKGPFSALFSSSPSLFCFSMEKRGALFQGLLFL